MSEVSDAPSYPPHWELDVVLTDGGTVHVRPLLPTDREAYLRFFHGLSAETRYYRFFSPKSVLTDVEVTYFTTVDHVDRVALAAFVGSEIVAVARYDRLEDDDGTQGPDAEVAFTIDDAHQGRGLGALMLEYLAAAGREHGLTRFVAETMPDNRPMLAVFHAAGYHSVNRFSAGMVEVEFPIAATDDARAVVERREHRAEAASVRRILRPGSVVVVGDVLTPDSLGSRVVGNVIAGGFAGPVHLVDPTASDAATVAGLEVKASLGDIEGDVDLAVLVGPGDGAADLVGACAAKGVQGLLVMSTGVRDIGITAVEGQRAVVRAARRAGIRLIGPGSFGVIEEATGLWATVSPVVPSPGRIGLMSESGAVGLALLEWAAWRGVGVSSFVSAGDKADVSGNDLLQYWEEDPDTDVVLLYLESFGNPRKFARLARRVSMTTPIVAVRPGGDAAVEALFRQAGVIRVDSISELFDVAALLVGPVPVGRRVAVVAAGRGPGLLALDALRAARLEVAHYRVGEGGPGTAVGLVEVDPEAPDQVEVELSSALADDGVDAVHLVLTPGEGPTSDAVGEAVRRVTASAVKPVVVTYLSPAPPPPALREGPEPLAVFEAPNPAALALARVVDHAEWRRRDHRVGTDVADIDREGARRIVEQALTAGDGDVALGGEAAAALLAAYGIVVAGAGSDASGASPTRVAVAVDHDPALGPLLRVELGSAPTSRPAVRLVPLSDADVDDLVSALGVAEHDERGASRPGVSRLLGRLGRLADDLPEIDHLRIEGVDVVTGRAPDGAVHVHLHAVPAAVPDLVRRLRT